MDLFYKPRSIVPLALFRIGFGFFLAAEGFGAILTGWVKETYVDALFTFHFIGFEWLPDITGPTAYLWFSLLGISGLMICLGFAYRMGILAYFLLWSVAYLSQKTHYNNHYYLMMLLTFMMNVMPAHRLLSLDVRLGWTKKEYFVPNWIYIWIIGQVWIVYTYAAVAKIYPEWINGSVVALFMEYKKDYLIIGPYLQNGLLQFFLVWGGIFFDALIIPVLLFLPKARVYAIGFALVFHMFNSVVFQVGIFPYVALLFSLFFFPSEQLERVLFRRRIIPDNPNPPSFKKVGMEYGVAIWLLVQLALPIRHHFIPGDVFWTEEGHRLSWRMMLRSKSGSAKFTVEFPDGRRTMVDLDDHLTSTQISRLPKRPDMIWQFAQYLKDQYREEGPVRVFATCYVSLNGRQSQLLVDPKVDLAAAEWHLFKHEEWILAEGGR